MKIFKEIADRGSWLPKVLASYTGALSQIGRGADAQQALAEALPLARQLRNDSLIAEILNHQGDSLYYRGDFKGARAPYLQAGAVASKAKLRPVQLRSQLNLAKVNLEDGRPQLSAADLVSSEERPIASG